MTEGQTAEPLRRVKVVYCGGCNPHIDRSAVAAGLPLDDPDVGAGATVHLSGCPRACASDHQLTGSQDAAPGAAGETPAAEAAPRPGHDHVTVVVAGELVDGVPTPEAQLTPTITRKLKE
ncbi:MAG TPA: hypothetical protein VFD50_10020 [Thermoleophilia bacterium]|nr:hypothetical protein [Thermoleophilia bacterium]